MAVDGRFEHREELRRPGPSERTRIILLCGGRGSASISTELLRRPYVHTSIVINGYDDGLSTGALRRMVPGLLGPSDFRKTFARLLNPAAPSQRALQVLLEHRLMRADGAAVQAGLRIFSRSGRASELPPRLASALRTLDAGRRTSVREYLAVYFDYIDHLHLVLDYSGFALGNLIFAGIYLKVGDFNETIRILRELCPVPADVLNVSAGECRWLAALKADGSLLAGESEIVAPQSASPIVGIYLLGGPVGAHQWRRVGHGSWQQKHAWLSAREMPTASSHEATDVIARSDMIIYGPGTQHSSLFPSYRIAAKSLKASRASVKALVINLDPDHDIQNLSAVDVIERALYFLGDAANGSRVITHVAYDPTATLVGGATAMERLSERCAQYGIGFVPGRYRDAARPDIHCGRAVVDALLALRGRPTEPRFLVQGPAGAAVRLGYGLTPPWGDRSRAISVRQPAAAGSSVAAGQTRFEARVTCNPRAG